MNKDNSIYFGIDKSINSVVHISQVLSGEECNCKCILCGEPLIAKKGQERTHHFAHKSLTDCTGGKETALHSMAKEIIMEAKTFWLPAVDISCGDIEKSEWNPITNSTISYYSKNLYDETVIEIEDVYVEKIIKFNNGNYIKPDLQLVCKNRILLVEIKVTHDVELKKKKLIKQNNYSVIEIELLEEDIINLERLKEKLLYKTICKKWIYNTKAGKKFDLAKKIRYRYNRLANDNSKCPITNKYFPKGCADCNFNIKYDGEFEWCTYPFNING